jgi:hypothetical protein
MGGAIVDQSEWPTSSTWSAEGSVGTDHTLVAGTSNSREGTLAQRSRAPRQAPQCRASRPRRSPTTTPAGHRQRWRPTRTAATGTLNDGPIGSMVPGSVRLWQRTQPRYRSPYSSCCGPHMCQPRRHRRGLRAIVPASSNARGRARVDARVIPPPDGATTRTLIVDVRTRSARCRCQMSRSAYASHRR